MKWLRTVLVASVLTLGVVAGFANGWQHGVMSPHAQVTNVMDGQYPPPPG